MIRRIASFILTIFTVVNLIASLSDSLRAETVLGQETPGRTPELFCPGIFAEGSHSAPVFTPDGTEMYWSRYYTPEGQRSRTQHIFVSFFIDGKWSEPGPASFSGAYNDGGPFITIDGKQLFFYSNRPATPDGEPADEFAADIWVMDRQADRWGEPRRLELNTEKNESSPSVAADGTLYFQSNRAGTRGIFDTYSSKPEDGRFESPQNLGGAVNCPNINFSPLIAPDGGFLIQAYNNNAPHNGLFISFRKPGGGWTQAVGMGESVNSTSFEVRARIEGCIGSMPG